MYVRGESECETGERANQGYRERCCGRPDQTTEDTAVNVVSGTRGGNTTTENCRRYTYRVLYVTNVFRNV